MTRIEAIRRTSAPEAIVEHLLGRIRGGEFGPGDWLPSERLLQEQLGVGRLSLREAMARLSALGIIRVDHGKGACIQTRIDKDVLINALIPSFPARNPKTLQDLVEARALIEGELAAKAALHHTDEDIDKLQRILDEPGEAMVNDRVLAELDYSFHREVARIADNEFLTVMMEALSDHIRTFLLNYVRAYRDPVSVIDRHRPLLKAISTGNADLARDCARKHIDVCRSSLDAYIKGEAGHHEIGTSK
jgi:GntR family transcriptional repressor for pyruvate dehydrogenase complex